MIHDQSNVAIVGAGLAGSLLAGLLADQGYSVTMYERRSDPRAGTAERGRSINLAISARGLDAIARLGLDDRILAQGLPMYGRMVHDRQGGQAFQSYSSTGGRSIYSISRGVLNVALLDAALARPGVSARFGHRLITLDPDSGLLEFDTPDGPVAVTADVVLGADGAHSAVRARLQSVPGFSLRMDYLGHAYKELTLPPVDGDFALDPSALHIWPRGSSMMIALPNPDRTFTCTLFWPTTGTGSFEEIATGEDADRHFRVAYPDVVALMPNLIEEFDSNPVGSLLTVRCARWQVGGRVALLGDAAHAVVPFYGQGANCAFEDCVAIADLLAHHGGDWSAALAEYETLRIPNANAIADMALANFVEMRDKSASAVFRATRRLQHALERAFPEDYKTRYELVSFSTIPYAEVLSRSSPTGQLASVARGTASAARRLVDRALSPDRTKRR